jgi:membrane associated rhomboid family serine protease
LYIGEKKVFSDEILIMYYQQPQGNIFDSAKDFFSRKSFLPRLILINVGVFVLVYFVNLFVWLFQINIEGPSALSPLSQLLAVPSSMERLLLKPWTLITYMFLHERFFHLLFNMIILYFGGSIFLQYLSQRKLLSTYIIGGLTGAFFYILAYNSFPVFNQANLNAVALGASASVLAVMVAIASFVPQYTVNLVLLGPVRLKYLAIAFIVIDIFSIIGNNPGGHIAHIGGAFWGFAYVYLLKRNVDVYSIFNGFYRQKITVSHRKGVRTDEGRPLSDDEYNKRKNASQEEIDKILEKIAKSGYGSLSSKEKEMLFRMSNKQ